jgi:hypothetical protein
MAGKKADRSPFDAVMTPHFSYSTRYGNRTSEKGHSKVRYLFAVIDHQTNSGTADESVSIDVFNDKLEKAGRRIIAAGLVAPSEAKVFDHRDGQASITTGPVNDSADYMSGFWIIDAPNDATAFDLAAEASQSCNRRVEVRSFLR